ncbi:uncharacterized protein LOC100892172 [Strongylocentrotus purpuratus]|uniref:Soluble interferon alpha/beta receptor OPG204 n=1 Tax=Strongylocentrotus purpuratus TaxID=7668 RepID=A0A7M7NLL2_STRPU|nr:uncharacterized protein LOC100892172 [Strongylocentrotus purpuratus]
MIPSMLCNAEGFTSITWLKDDSFEFPFGFMPGSSKAHTSLTDCNQTVQIKNTQKDAIGNYTCMVSNGEETIQRTFHVIVEDEKFTGDPSTIDHANCSDMAVKPGEDVYLFCEFCAGDKSHVTEVRWNKLDEDENLVPVNQLTDEEDEDGSRYWESPNIYSRDCLETYNLPAAVGRQLIIRDVTTDMFGSYVITANYTLSGAYKGASIQITVSRAPDTMTEITVGVVVSLTVIFLVVTVVTVTCHKYHLTLQLYWKNRFGKIEEHDGMEHDAFISFSDSPNDGRFAIAVAQLLLQRGYNVWMRDMHSIPGEALIAEEIVSMKRSRRCILIISPEYSTSSHSEVLTDLAADQTLRKRSRIIPILYRDVTREHFKRHQRLAEIIRVCPCIIWQEMEDAGSLDDQLSNNISGSSSEGVHGNGFSGSGLGEMPNNDVSGSGLEEMRSNNLSGRGTVEMPSNVSGCGTGEMPINSNNSINSTNDDEGTIACHSNNGMRMTRRDGDRDQLIEDQEEGERKKREMKMKKQREKNEKKLLLKMPPKRLVASHAGNTASMVV